MGRKEGVGMMTHQTYYVHVFTYISVQEHSYMCTQCFPQTVGYRGWETAKIKASSNHIKGNSSTKGGSVGNTVHRCTFSLVNYEIRSA